MNATLEFTYQQPKSTWMKNGCANNRWLCVDEKEKEFTCFVSPFLAQQRSIKVDSKSIDILIERYKEIGYKEVRLNSSTGRYE